MSRRETSRPSRSTEPLVHTGSDGFSWLVRFPERGVALGAKKPRATVEISSGCDESESWAPERIHVPVAVARALDASDGPEPTCRAELLYCIRERADACAWARVVDMASRREHSASEAVARLVRDGYSSTCAERAVERAKVARIIDDGRFVDSFVRAKLASGWGPLRIERELSLRGIEVGELPGWPDAYAGDGSTKDRALELLSRRRIPDKNAYPKLVRFLASKGYPLSVAKDAVAERLACDG